MSHAAKAIEEWPIERLRPYDRNSRTHSEEQITQIAESIERFGFTNPILVDPTSTIIAGHGRLEAALKLGLKDVPVIVLSHLTDAERRAYIIADNKIALNAGWDLEVLAAEMLDLDKLGFDLTVTGFSLPEIEDITIDASSFGAGSASDQGKLDEKKKVRCPNCEEEFTP